MTTMTPAPDTVTGGVDTHSDMHVAAAVDHLGGVLGTKAFPTTPKGYRQLLRWLQTFGLIFKVGVEGTGSYGLGLARLLAENDVAVIEVARPNRQVRRRHGRATWSTRSPRPGPCCPARPPRPPRPTTVPSRRYEH